MRYSLQSAFRHWRIGGIVYLIQLLFVIPVGLQLYEVMDSSFGQAVSLSELMKGFNYALLQDFINVHGASLSPLIGYIRWLLPVYLLISAFVSAGIWYALVKNKGTWTSFWIGSSSFFFRFTILGIIFLLLFILWTMLVWTFYVGSFFNMMETWLDDSKIVHLGIFLLISWLLGLTFLFVWTSFSKIVILQDPTVSSWRAILKGGRQTIKKYIQLLPALLLFALLITALYALGLWMEKVVGITSVRLILFFLILQQCIIWLKIMIRIWVYDYLWRKIRVNP